MRYVGTVSRGIRLPVVTKGDDIVKIITDIIGDGMKLSEYGFRLRELRKRLPEKVLEVLSAF